MTCSEFSEVVHELLRPEHPASESVRRGLEHALLCDDCASVLAEQRDLNDQLDDLADADRDLAAPAHVERDLLVALRAQHPAPKPAAMPIWRWVAAFGLATAAVMIGAVFVSHRPMDGPAGPAAQPAPRTASPSMPLEASRVAASAPNSASETTEQAAVATTSATSVEQSSQQFYRMPYADSGESTDGDSVLRVEMPASELASMGLDSSAGDAASDDGTQMVTADVVVAEDGTLEAIRLSPQQDQEQEQNGSTARF
jgi:hypothetical protein